MPGNPYSFETVMKKPIEKKKPVSQQPMYIPPEQVDFSKVKIDPATMQIVKPETNIISVSPEFKTAVTKEQIKPEEEKAISDYFKMYDELTPKAELETNIIKHIEEHISKGIEQVKEGNIEKGGLNLALGLEKGVTAPFAMIDQAVRKIPHIGNTVADVIASPFIGVDEYMKFGLNVNKEISDFLGIPKPDKETQDLIDEFGRTTAQLVVAPYIVKGLKMGYDKLPFSQKKQMLIDVTADLKQRSPELAGTEILLKQGEKPVESIDKRLQLESEEPLLNIAETPPEITITKPDFTAPEGKKMRGFFKRIQDKIAETLGNDVRDKIIKNPESYYEPQSLDLIKNNLKDLSDSDLISSMTDDGLQRLPVSVEPNSNVYVLKELERYNRAIGR